VSLRALLRYTLAEIRGAFARLGFYVACLGVGVAAVVAVAGLTDALDRGIREQARTLLAADLSVSGRRPLPEGVDRMLASLGAVETTRVRELVTVVARPTGGDGSSGSPGRSRLVELKVVEGRYPFYGELSLDPDVPLQEMLEDGGAVVAPELLEFLGLGVGDMLRVGQAELEIRGVVTREPDRLSISFSLAPRVFLDAAGLERTGLATYGSRIEHTALARFPADTPREELETGRDVLEQRLPDAAYYEIETWRDAQPNVRRGLARVDRYLGLVALLSLIVGAVGVAQAIRAFLGSRLDAIAVLRCLGVRPRHVFGLYLGESAMVGLAGGVFGAALGTAALAAVPWLWPGIVRGDLVSMWQPAALARGVLLGVTIAVVFSLPALASVTRVPPVRVFRRTAEPLPPPLWVRLSIGAAVAGGLLAIASWQARSLWLGLSFTAGFGAVFGLLTAAASVMTWLAARSRREDQPPWMRHALASLSRPGSATLGAVTALGVGVSIVLALLLVERRLTAELSEEVPEDAPSVFLIDVQPDQLAGLRETLHESGAKGIASAPMVVGRLSKIDGTPVSARIERAEERGDGQARWALSREQRMTWAEELPAGNELVAGELWSDPEAGEVSVEQDFAEGLGVDVGSTLTFDIQGVPVSTKVTSLRRVDWTSFAINFFVLAEPSALRGAPHVHVVTARVPAGDEQRVQDLVASEFPNVTVLRVREVLDRVVSLLNRLGLGVRALGGFTVIAGLAILGGAVSAGSVRRRREVALLKTLGMTRPAVVAAFALEYVLLGVVAGLIGLGAGTGLAWAVVTQVLELGWQMPIAPLVVAMGASVLLAVAGGLAASAGALREPPAAVLKAG
jgi:putative ABC transport system permease protein